MSLHLVHFFDGLRGPLKKATGAPYTQEKALGQDSTVGLCLQSYGGLMGGGCFS